MNIENTSYVTLFAMVINVTKTLNNVRSGKTRLGCKKKVKKTGGASRATKKGKLLG